MKKQQTNTTEIESNLQNEIISILRVLRDKTMTVGFAESCTGGLLSSSITALAGVSDVFLGSVVSYDNKVKQKFLGVSEETLKNFGAVSKETAQEMAKGAVSGLGSSVAVSITGIAGPSGGTAEKPVGTVFIAVVGAKRDVKVYEHHFDGDRKQVQLQSCVAALQHLNKFINN